ncbi:SseB family protein [Cryptosporangium aurantiacum]|uniref:SseB protein N-terminal domain-containing protein n=1 Tax=Cryptosporangium aurantiacum TaxID=134849 RepID=A0A1M7NI85_9ACTN|nr:SseB family protein [Cryptosporangium aurantiacum]SHN03536.1 SseB protein N-terminal domain-containing protein [Cryptosporangium aurantiacum]
MDGRDLEGLLEAASDASAAGASAAGAPALGASRAGAEALGAALAALRDADLVVPVPPPAAAGRAPLSWATVTVDGRTWLPAFTSEDAFARSGAGEQTRTIAFLHLAAFWPDPRWHLAVNPGLPSRLLLEAGTVARLARDEPDVGVEQPVLQKVLTFDQVTAYLGGERLGISGFAHRLADAVLPDDPAALLTALGLGTELCDADGAIYLLRWGMVGATLYRVPYGGADEDGAAAMSGWVVEPPPFRGTGFVAGPDLVIREYKVDGVLPPHGSEIYHLPPGGPERRIAVFDADQRRWLMVRAV